LTGTTTLAAELEATPGLLWQAWDDSASHVYNPLTGETHLLSSFPAEVLSVLSERAMTYDQLTGEFTRLMEAPPSDVRPPLEHCLRQLQALELVQHRG